MVPDLLHVWHSMDYASYGTESLGLLEETRSHKRSKNYLECHSRLFNVAYWRERYQRAFENMERHTVDLKLSFIRTLMEWMAVLSSQPSPSIFTFIDECSYAVLG